MAERVRTARLERLDRSAVLNLTAAPKESGLAEDERPPLGVLMAMVFRALVDRLDEYMRSQGVEPVRPAHLYVMRSLYPERATITELAQRCGVTKQAISQLLVSLQSMDVVERVVDETDARQKVVALTAKGEHVLSTAVLGWSAIELEWAALLPPKHMAKVRRAMLEFVEADGQWRRGDLPILRAVW